MIKVSCVQVDTYDSKLLDAAVEKHFQELDFESRLRPGLKVLIKPNLLAARNPSLAVTTHPELIAAVVRWLRKHGIEDITLADTPGGMVSEEILDRLYTVCGLQKLSGMVKLNHDLSTVKKNGFPILKVVAEADLVINCCKLKTHGLTVQTGAVKNLFGTIPGLIKPEIHCTKPSAKSFSDALIRLCDTISPAVSLMDAIDCMEGNGPGSGELRHVGMTLASPSPYALDEKAVELMGLRHQQIPLLVEAAKRGKLKEEILLCGDSLIPVSPPFRLPDSVLGKEGFFTPAGLLHHFFKKRKVYPELIESQCVGCGKCAESCPKHIIRIEGGKAHFQTKSCISCFCCQEMCPCHAIKIKV